MKEKPSHPARRSPKGSSRREFLAHTASLAGAGAVLGACGSVSIQQESDKSVPKAAPRAPLGASDPIHMAVIGTGGMGTAHCQAFLKFPEQDKAKVKIVALADVCQPRLENARRICSDGQPGVTVDTYGDYRKVLARDDLHGVLIASPEHWHSKMAEDAIAAGKDVYVEKPMTLSLPDALRLRQVVQANPDMILQVGTQYITEGRYHAAGKLIAEGAIGKPTLSQTSYCRNSKDGEWNYYDIDPAWEPGKNLDWDAWCGPLGSQPWDPKVYARWRRYRKFSTGIIGDLLVHQMTPLIMALDQGWPTRVVATGGHYIDMEMENHDQVFLNIEFEKGHTLIVAGSTCNEQGLEVMIRGHQATLFMGGKDVVLRPERIFVDDVDEQKVVCEAVSAHDKVRLDWLDCIRSRQPNLSQVELGTKVMVIVDLATHSLWEGKAYQFDPKTMTAQAI